MKKKKELMLSILGVICLVLITVGVTYAFFSYSKEGTTENTITTGTITFIYEEIDKQGAGISVEDAYPISDEVGKAMTASNEVFNFKVKSETANNASIPYTVTARMKADSTLSQEAVRIYLTEVVGETETELLLDNYDNLPQTSVSVPVNTVEKEIYTDRVPANTASYEKNFRLRMWVDEDTDFSDGTMNDKTFTVTVNVYANAKVVTGNEDTTNTLDSLSISDCTFDPVFDSATTEYTCDVKNSISSIEVAATATSEKATVTGLGTKELESEVNTIKVIVTAESGDRKVYTVTITKKESIPLTAADSLSIGDAVVGIDGSKWHVLESSASGIETVTLLSDYNLNTDGSYNTECGKDINNDTFCSQMRFSQSGAADTDKYSESDSNNIGYFIKNTYKPLVTAALPGTTTVTLPTAAQLARADGQSFSTTLTTLSITASWLKTTSYWTKTNFSADEGYVWAMKGNESKMYRGLATSISHFGTRPVIKTLKTNLKLG